MEKSVSAVPPKRAAKVRILLFISVPRQSIPHDADRFIRGGYGEYRARASNIQYALSIRVRSYSHIAD